MPLEKQNKKEREGKGNTKKGQRKEKREKEIRQRRSKRVQEMQFFLLLKRTCTREDD